jgi:DNA-binding SARP family transcriptional activator|tara:strand:- start:673 stop:861 length:189 start_codon:yes stop_codon:yes gene_type:complete
LESDRKNKLKELNEEIRYYPGPIAGCDAQFNWLLEERIRLANQLKELTDISHRELTDVIDQG